MRPEPCSYCGNEVPVQQMQVRVKRDFFYNLVMPLSITCVYIQGHILTLASYSYRYRNQNVSEHISVRL